MTDQIYNLERKLVAEVYWFFSNNQCMEWFHHDHLGEVIVGAYVWVFGGAVGSNAKVLLQAHQVTCFTLTDKVQKSVL